MEKKRLCGLDGRLTLKFPLESLWLPRVVEEEATLVASLRALSPRPCESLRMLGNHLLQEKKREKWVSEDLFSNEKYSLLPSKSFLFGCRSGPVGSRNLVTGRCCRWWIRRSRWSSSGCIWRRVCWNKQGCQLCPYQVWRIAPRKISLMIQSNQLKCYLVFALSLYAHTHVRVGQGFFLLYF